MGWKTGLFLVLAAAWSLGARAHEAHRHGGPAPDGGHRAAMEAVREGVPAALRAVREPPAPADGDALAAAEGAYREHCAPCHGEGGRGDGLAAQGLPTRPANFLDPAHADFYTAGERFWIITHGIPEMGMPGFGDLLDEATRWGLVRHLRRLQAEGR